jgi:hypothetical protein
VDAIKAFPDQHGVAGLCQTRSVLYGAHGPGKGPRVLIITFKGHMQNSWPPGFWFCSHSRFRALGLRSARCAKKKQKGERHGAEDAQFLETGIHGAFLVEIGLRGVDTAIQTERGHGSTG